MRKSPAANRLSVDHVVRRRADVGVAVVGSEAVLLEPTRTGTHRLDGIATVVWESLDGASTLREISAELAAAFGADPVVVQRDVHRLVADFYDNQLLEPDPRISARGDTPPAPPAPEPDVAGRIRYVAVPPST